MPTVHEDLAARLQEAFEAGRTDWAKLAHEVEALAVPVSADLEAVRRRLRTLDNALLLSRSQDVRAITGSKARRLNMHVAMAGLECAKDTRALLRATAVFLRPGVAEGGRPALVDLIAAQVEWSASTFGPGVRTAGVLAHLRKELLEVEDAPHDLTEWIDVVILALDGAWRHAPADLGTRELAVLIVDTLVGKYAKNRAREWPDWRTADPDAPIEHVKAASE